MAVVNEGTIVDESEVDALGTPEVGRVGRAGADERGARLALVAFVVGLVVAVPVLVHQGRSQWFVADDWDFLVSRHLTDVSGLFRPHAEHWTTLPIVVYRLLYAAFGIRTICPTSWSPSASTCSWWCCCGRSCGAPG